VEPAQKTGEANLAVLNAASKIIGKGDKGDDDSSIVPNETSTDETVNDNWWSTLLNRSSTPSTKGSSSLSLAEQYFAGTFVAMIRLLVTYHHCKLMSVLRAQPGVNEIWIPR
jgi:hypothetical protein